MEKFEYYCAFHWLSGQNCEDGPEIEIIRREHGVRLMDFLQEELGWKNPRDVVAGG